MNGQACKIVSFQQHHLLSVVDIHFRAFPGFFLSFLGSRFLREFYSAFLHEENGVALVALESEKGRLLGFVVGTTQPEGFFKRLLKQRWWAFCLASANALLRKPGTFPRIFRALFYRGTPPPGMERALLSSIAVDPDLKGSGLGQALQARWVEEVRKRGMKGCYLTTDAENNDAVNRFYMKCGWRVESTYDTPEGRRMNRYILDFG